MQPNGVDLSLYWGDLYFPSLSLAKGVSTRQRWGEGMQVPYSLYRGQMMAGPQLNHMMILS